MVKPKPRELSAAEEKFCRLVAGGLDKTSAFREAFPHRANKAGVHVRGTEFAKKFKARIDELAQKGREVAKQEFGVDSAVWLAGVMRLANYDMANLFDKNGKVRPIHEIDAETRQAIVAVEMDEDGRPKKYRMAQKNHAWEMIGKHVGAFLADNRQKGDALAGFMEFIASRAKLRVVHDVTDVLETAQEKPHVAAFLPRG